MATATPTATTAHGNGNGEGHTNGNDRDNGGGGNGGGNGNGGSEGNGNNDNGNHTHRHSLHIHTTDKHTVTQVTVTTWCVVVHPGHNNHATRGVRPRRTHARRMYTATLWNRSHASHLNNLCVGAVERPTGYSVITCTQCVVVRHAVSSNYTHALHACCSRSTTTIHAVYMNTR